MDAITAFGLTKEYVDASRPALAGVNLQIPAGQAFACVGEEGAGKTTLIRLLSGLSRPTNGECSVLGYSPFFEAERLHALVGTVVDTARLYQDMTLTENLLFFAGLNGVDENDAIDRMSLLLHKLDIWENRDEKVSSMSTGAVRRASLARALIHRPRVLLIDAPNEGLDQETGDSMAGLLSHLVSEEGLTVLLCTRNMRYAQRLCSGFSLLQDGVLLAKGDLESLRKGAGVRYRAVLQLGEGERPPKSFRLCEDGKWRKEIISEEELPRLISQAVAAGRRLYGAWLEKPDLKEIYAAYLAGSIQRAGVSDEQDDEYEAWTECTPGENGVSADPSGIPAAAPAEDGEGSLSRPEGVETGDSSVS